MNLKNSSWLVFATAALLTLLFYKQGIGLNLLLFELIFFIWLLITKQINLKNKVIVISGVSCLLTAFFTVFVYTGYSYLIHFLALFIFIGALSYPNARSIVTAYLGAWSASLFSIITFINRLTNTSVNGKAPSAFIKKGLIFLVPLAIIIVFIVIYSNANADFGGIVISVLDSISDAWNSLFKNMDWGIVFTYIFCLFLSIFLLVRYTNSHLSNHDKNASLQLQRIRKKAVVAFKTMSLKNELRAGVFLLITINLLLLVVNFLDIKNVWFGFEWEGERLKEFVHEGTYLLILSILISIALVLYYFRRNINFYNKNNLLKKLSYFWIVQNVILAFSVGVRNYWYIEYYALAYKRIGVIFFLIATIYGLFTVFIKVKDKKSSFYLFKNNAMCVFLILVVTSAVPWDIVIAKYNYAHAKTAYVELDYLAGFSNKALPYLDKSLKTVTQLKANQPPQFLPDNGIKPTTYVSRIENKKVYFKKTWERKSWLAWNWPEYSAYNKLYFDIE